MQSHLFDTSLPDPHSIYSLCDKNFFALYPKVLEKHSDIIGRSCLHDRKSLRLDKSFVYPLQGRIVKSSVKEHIV